MEGYKAYRYKNNPKEKEMHDKFLEQHNIKDDMHLIVFGHNENLKPNDYLTNREKRIVLSTIQWLGSPIGTNFLEGCGFIEQNVKT